MCASLAAEEIKYPSPDGRFAFRISEDLKIDLIKTSGQILVDLGKLYVEPDTSSKEETILVCDVCGRPATETVTVQWEFSYEDD